jgi:nucleosome binding factor SPN SPT16 subunit
MADDQVKIDKQLFHNRLSAFIAQWKQDKRSGDSVFNGANSVVVCIGKSEEAQTFNKVTAFQASCSFFLLYRREVF